MEYPLFYAADDGFYHSYERLYTTLSRRISFLLRTPWRCIPHSAEGAPLILDALPDLSMPRDGAVSGMPSSGFGAQFHLVRMAGGRLMRYKEAAGKLRALAGAEKGLNFPLYSKNVVGPSPRRKPGSSVLL
jgi:hypothetical protein